jgi:hypothetical protein
MPYKVSITEAIGREKSRALKKAVAYVLTFCGLYALAGTVFLSWALFKNYFCLECQGQFESRISIWYLVAVGLGVILARMGYKYIKRTEAYKAAIEALKRAGSPEAFGDESGFGSDDEVERMLMQMGIDNVRPPRAEKIQKVVDEGKLSSFEVAMHETMEVQQREIKILKEMINRMRGLNADGTEKED